MKYIGITIFLFAIAASGFSQNDVLLKQKEDVKTDSQQIHSLFGEVDSHGFYFSPSVAYTSVNKNDGLTVGGQMVYIADHVFAIGLGGKGFFTSPKVDEQIGEGTDYYSYVGGYGGIVLEPILVPKSPIHLSFPVLLGVGGLSYMRDFTEWNSNTEIIYGPDYFLPRPFLVAEPAAELEINMFKHFRIAFSTSYRFTSDIIMKYPGGTLVTSNKKPLNGLSYGVVFKVGLF